MFKKNNNPDIFSENQTPTANNLPIYILGQTPLTYFLAYKFTLSDEKVVLLNKSLSGPDSQQEISIREEHSLKKNKYIFASQNYSSENAKMLIITSPPHQLKSDLMLLSPSHLINAPIVVFSPLCQLKIIESLLSHNTIRGYFDGYLSSKDNQISILSAEPQITLSKPFNTLEFSLKALSIFHSANILSQTREDKKQIFWEDFAVYSIASLLSAQYRQSLFNILKNKDRQQEVSNAVNEICQLAQADNIKLEADELLKKLYNTPINYSYNTQTDSLSSRHELNTIHITISDFAHLHKISIPTLKSLNNKYIFV